MKLVAAALAVTGSLALSSAALAREYPIGGPVQEHDMEIASSYLLGIKMAPMSPDMPTGPDVVHLETDVHATADNPYGFPDGAWIPYLTITYHLVKKGTTWHSDGHMLAMTAKDGPHYANDVRMDGPGSYTVTLTYASPETNGFRHHVDKETGVPGWWAPFSETFTFKYPQS